MSASPPPPATRRLGKTGLDLPVLGFGGAPLGDLYRKLPEEEAVAAVVSAVRNGVFLIDTSPLYGFGLSEHRIGAALRRVPESKVVLSTKVGRVADPFHPPASRGIFAGGLPHSLVSDYTYKGALRSIEQSLLRLGVGHLDIVLVHDLDVWTHGKDLDKYYEEAATGCVPALRELKEQGVIRAFGVGVNEPEAALRFCRDHQPDAVLLAGRYSLLEQPALTEFLPHAEAEEIGVILGGVYNSGILATGNTPDARYNYGEPDPGIREQVSRLEEVCREFSLPLRQAALQFVFGHPSVSSVVLGGVHPREVIENRRDLESPVPFAFWDRLREAQLLPEAVPTPAAS